jgi:hypothetical protein
MFPGAEKQGCHRCVPMLLCGISAGNTMADRGTGPTRRLHRELFNIVEPAASLRGKSKLPRTGRHMPGPRPPIQLRMCFVHMHTYVQVCPSTKVAAAQCGLLASCSCPHPQSP